MGTNSTPDTTKQCEIRCKLELKVQKAKDWLGEETIHPPYKYLTFMLVEPKTGETVHKWEPVRIEPGETVAVEGLPILVENV